MFQGIWLSLRGKLQATKVIALFSVGLILIWFLESLSCNMFSTLSEIYFWKKWKRNTSLIKIQRTTKYFFLCWTISSGVKISPWNIQSILFSVKSNVCEGPTMTVGTSVLNFHVNFLVEFILQYVCSKNWIPSAYIRLLFYLLKDLRLYSSHSCSFEYKI